MTHSVSVRTCTEGSNLTRLSASEIARHVANGLLSSREVVEAHIRRIEAVNPRLNAVVVPLFEQARIEARHADEMRARCAVLGPLHGVPITLKESFMVAGTPSTAGLMSRRTPLLGQEGPLISRLRRAGAIVLGKTNASQLLLSLSGACENPVYGRTSNPWNLTRSPGGSSGGEAAIIAACGSALGVGGDNGGSIRVSAHFCGLYSLLPTAGRLTNLDTVPYADVAGQETTVAQPCPIARSAQDLSLAMRVLAAPGLNADDPTVPPVPWPDPAGVAIPQLRIGMYTDNGLFPVSPAIRRAVETAAQRLRAQGAIVESWTPPDVAEAVRIWVGLRTADGLATYRRLLGDDPSDPSIAAALRSSPKSLSVDQYWQLVEQGKQYRHDFMKALDKTGLDALLCPPYALPAPPHGSGGLLNTFNAGSYAVLFNMLAFPAGVAPITRVQPGEESERSMSDNGDEKAARSVEMNSAGLPVGVQVAARPWREDIVLALMGALEEQTSGEVPICEGLGCDDIQ